jgi:transketolase
LAGSCLEKVSLGAYSVHETAASGPSDSVASHQQPPDAVILGTGSEVSLCIEAAKIMEQHHGLRIRVVSMPSWELFEKQPLVSRRSLLNDYRAPVLSVEAASTLGWGRYAHASLGVYGFGVSAPYKQAYARFGLTPENISGRLLDALSKLGPSPPDLSLMW